MVFFFLARGGVGVLVPTLDPVFGVGAELSDGAVGAAPEFAAG